MHRLLLVTNTLAYCVHLLVTKKMKCCEYSTLNLIDNFSISSLLTDWPNKLECYRPLGYKGLLLTNTLAYSVKSDVKKKMKCCENSPYDCINNFSLSSLLTDWANKLERNITVGCKGLVVTITLAF